MVEGLNAVRRRASVRTSMSRIVALLFVATPIIALVSLLIAPPKSVSANTITTDYAWNASVQTWTVPYGVSSITVTANGGRGGTGGNDNSPGAAGGSWGRVIGTISVAQGDVIRVFSGGAGGNGSGCLTGAGAGSGGGSALAGYGGGAGGVAGSVGCSGGGGGGGGASVVSKNGANQFIAGGAGGGAGDSNQAVGASYPGTGGTTISGTAGGAGARGDSCSNSSDGGGGGGGGGGANGGAGGSTFNAHSGAWECQGYGGNRGSNFIVAGASSTTNTTATTNDSLVTISYTLSTPSTPNLVDASDSGFSNSDNITNVTTPTFSGTATGGSTVQLQVNGVNSGSTCTANASTGAWSCTTAGLTHGTYSVTAASTLNGVTTVSSAISIQVRTSSGSPPTPTRNGSGTLTNGQTETVRFYFGADVTGFELADVTVSGGSLSSFTGSGRDYSATFTPTSNSSGTASISIGANKYTDLAGNSNTSSGSALSIAYETSPPTMTVSASPSIISSGGTSTVTFTASEATSTFALEDVSATLGTLSNFQSVNSTSYTATFTAAQSVDGTAAVTVSLGSFTDVAGNASIAAFTGNITVSNTTSSSGGRVSVSSESTKYIVEQFTTVETSTWTAPGGVTSVEYLVVGGGASGTRGYCGYVWGQGGGGGGVSTGTLSVTPGSSYSVTVGNGGLAKAEHSCNTGSSNSGGTSMVSLGASTLVQATGGSAGVFGTSADNGGTSGIGTRGGISYSYTGGDGGGNGVYGCSSPTLCGAGGGGGAGGTGSGLNGGPGVTSSITGSSVMYGSGGMGKSNDTFGRYYNTSGSLVSHTAGNGLAGEANTGRGGTDGCISDSCLGYLGGGSGIVVLRYALPEVSTPDLDVADDLGPSGTDDITSVTTLTFTGSAPVGSTVQLYVDGVASGSTCTANATTGVWSCDTGVLTAGDKVVTVESTTYLASSTETSTSAGLTVTVDTTEPTVLISASPTTLTLGETSTLTFTLSEDSSDFDLSDITVNGGTLSSFAGSGTSYTVTFTPTTNTQSGTGSVSVASGAFIDAAGNENTASSSTEISYDTQVPTVSNVTSSSTNGTFSVGDSVSIQVVFSEAVTVSGTPQLTLETGPTDRAVDYVSGSGTTTLTFAYTVQAGDSSLGLDYVDTSSLALNGGSIVDAAANAATLTLPAPGTTGSLAANKAIVVTSEPTKIVSVRTPVGTASGAAFTTQPQVSLQDLGNNVVTSDSSTVVTASVSAGATLVGTRTAIAVNGVATFDDLGISGTAGTAYTITYSATYGGNALTVATQSVTPTVGAATQIAITSQPVGDTAGALLSTQPVVKILDSGNNVVTTASASIEVSASGGTLGGTTTVSTTSGVATFTNLTFAGTANTNYTLTFAATGYTSQTSSSFSVGVGAATKLVLTTSANGATYNSAFTTQPVVEVRDAGNNKVTTATNTVTATLSSGTVVGTGNTTLTAVASGGVASFSGLGVSGAPSSLAVTVTYSSGSLTTTSDSITLSKADQTVTFADPADRAWSATAFAVAPTSSAGLTVAISSSTTPICTTSGLNITMVSVGTCTIVASQPGNDYYNAASSVTQSFEISRASQTITASNFANRSWTPTTASISSSTATASSGLTVSWSSTTTDVCTVTGTTLALVSSGTCSLTASQPGDTLYSAATDVVRTFVIERVTVSRGAFSIDQKTYGDAAFDLVNPTATFGGTDVAGTWSYVSATNSVATVSGNRVTIVGQGTSRITATFTPEDTGKYNTGSEQTTLTVVRAAPALGALSVPSPNKSFGDAAFSLTAPTATFGGTDVAGSWTYSSATPSVATISGSTVTVAGAGSSTLTATFTPTDSTNYSSGSVTATLTIDKAAPSFSWSNVSATFGDVNATITAPTVVGSIAGTWAYASATTSVVAISGGTAFDFGAVGTSLITATFTPTDTTNYVSGGTVAMTVEVVKANQSSLTVTSVSGTFGSSLTLSVGGGTTNGAVSYAVTGDGCSESGGSLSRTNAGDCSVIATMAGDDSYEPVSSAATTVTFGRASQSALTVTSTSGTYGTPLTLSVGGGTTAGSVTYVATGVGCSQLNGVLTKDAAGDCSVTATMAGDDNYNAVSSSATTVTFARVAITVTADAKSMQYGSTEPALTHTITSGALVGSDALSGVLARASGQDVGTYAINQGTLANSNYTITYVGADLTITQRPITITATAATKEYGATDPTFTFVVTTGSLVDQDALTGSLGRESGANVGSYAMTIGTLANANYAITFVPANLTITQRPITITATAATKEYGATDPTLTYSLTTGSLAVGDSLTGTLSRVTGENVGTYAILRGTVDNTNYDITYTGALLSVTQRPITVTADAQTKEYGASDPQLTYAITTGSMSGSDTFTGTLSRAGGELVGTYAISQGTLANSNYDITYAGADLTVTQRQVTVTADSKSKEYGSGDPQLTYALTTGSLINGDELSGSLTRVSGENVGDYSINQGTLANSNYNITYVGANLSVVERPITVTAAAATKEYGATDPTFNYALTSGSLVGSDVLAGELSRANGANVGSYAMTIGTLANANYAITFVPANLTITPRPITVTAADKTKVFGSTDPSLTYSVTSGSLVGSDSFGGALSRTSGETVGTYSITQGSLDNSNYDITFVDGELTVTRATQNALSVTTNQVVYGTSVVLGSTGGSGTGDVTYAVTSAGTAGCSISSDTLTATGDVGSTCTVTATKAQSTNYSVASSSAQTITVIDRAITVTATAVSKTYGDTDPTLEYTITSGALVAGDELTGSLARVVGEDVGTRAINQGTLANANYAITFVAANLTIDPRPITVTATNTVKTFGDADPGLAYTITSGSLVGSDAFTGAISRNSGENIGSYVIGQGTLAHSNYEITFNDGSFVINGANQSGFTLSATDTSVIFQDSTTLSVSGGNGNGAVTYEVTDGTGGCTIAGSTLTAVSAGTCVVTAEKEAEGNYNAATSNSITITVTRRAQAIVFAQPLDRNFSTTSFDLAPSVDSGRTPALASQTTNVCTVSGMTVTMVNSGTCTLVASIDGTTNYSPATDVTQSFEISPVVPYAPILESLTASDGAISVSFTLGNSGGSALLNHEYSLDDGVTWNPWPTGSITSPLNISNLTNGVQYEVKVRAINAIGTGAESNMLAVTPVAPIIVVAAPVATDESTTTVVSSTTTVSVVTTVTRNRQGRGSTTTIARRAVTTTVASRNGQLTTTTTILLTTTTSSSTSTTATPTTSVERLTGAAERVTTTTVQTATSIFQSFAPTVTVANVPDTIPARLSPTVAAAIVDGKSVEVAVSQVEQQQIVATMGDSAMKIASIGESGAMEPLLTNGSVAFSRGSTIRIDGSGMLAGSQVAVWMYSTPMQLGTVDVKADGSFAEVLSIPSNVELGGHKIQFIGSKADGKEFQFAVGVTVVDETALIMNRAGAMTVAQASSLADANVVTVSTLSRDDASKMMLWFLVVLIMVAGLIAAKPKRMGLVVSRVERFEIATPWLSGFTIPRLLMVLVGSLAGFGAANSTYFDVSSPSALWVAIIVALGVLDVVAGGVAGAVFITSVAANGSINSMTDLRVAMLVAMLSVLPTTIARSIRPSGAHKSITTGVSMVMHTVVVVALLSLFAPISGMSYVIEQSIVEIAWVTIIAVAGRKALLVVTGSTDDHRASEVPALRLISALLIGVLVFSSPVTTVWTMTAWAVLVAIVVLGLRIRVGLRAPSANRVFVGSIAAGLILVISATGALIPGDRSTEITGATSVLPIGDMKVIGQLDVLIDGYPRTFVAINTGVGEITFINGAVGQSITIDSHTTDGDRIPLSDTNKLQLVRGQGITINANGYAANQMMNAWLFSDPVQLGNAATNDSGVLKSKFVVPPGPQDGEHTLQLRMVDAEGRLVNVGIPVLLLSQVPNGAA